MIQGLQVLVAIGLGVLALKLRNPAFAEVRQGLAWLIVLFSLITLPTTFLIGLKASRNASSNHILSAPIARRSLTFLGITIASLNLVLIVGSTLHFRHLQQRVLNADPTTLETLGHHLIVGYRRFESVKQLVEKRAIAALNSGVDLLLVAYDSDLYFNVMDALLHADQQHHLRLDRLAASRDRLRQSPHW